MRTLKHLITAAMAAALAFASCTKELEVPEAIGQEEESYSREKGAPVVFGASAHYEKPHTTKADFSGYTHDGKERIDWEEGDVVSIFCPESQNPWGHYWVEFPPTNVDNTSTARLLPSSSSLTWGGSIVHHFYGMYFNEVGSVHFSTTQNGVSYVYENSETSLESESRPLLTAFATANSREPGQPIKLTFTPVLNTFEIELKNTLQNNSAIKLSSVSLVSYSDDLAGSLLINISKTGKRTFEIEGYVNTIRIELDTPYILQPNATKSIKFYTLPQNIEKLSLVIEGELVVNNTKKVWNLDFKKNGEWVTFKKLMKYNINNICIPDHKKFIDEIEIYSTPGKIYFSPYGGKPLNDIKVKSYTRNEENTINYPLPWSWNNLSTFNWVNEEKSTFVYPAAQNNGETELIAEMKSPSKKQARLYELQRISLREKPPVEDKDLSMRTIESINPNEARYTANCYIVGSRGTYKFPLAYGNSIVNNRNNKAAYKYLKADSTSTVYDPLLLRFKNGAGEGIKNPYFTASSVSLVWEDSFNLIEKLSLKDAPAGDNSGALKYVHFELGNNIDNGNALIAVKNSYGQILWTWHIWVLGPTGAHIPGPGIPITIPHLSTSPLGSTYPKHKVSSNTYNIEINQLEDINATKKQINVIQLEGIENERCLYYALGRMTPLASNAEMHFIKPEEIKDPNEPYNVDVKDNYYTAIFNPITGERFPGTTQNVTFQIMTGNQDVAYAISNPTVICKVDEYINLWNNYMNIFPDFEDNYNNCIKTVYDPTPVNGRIPPKQDISFTVGIPKKMGGIRIHRSNTPGVPHSLKVNDFLEHTHLWTSYSIDIRVNGTTGYSHGDLAPVHAYYNHRGLN